MCSHMAHMALETPQLHRIKSISIKSKKRINGVLRFTLLCLLQLISVASHEMLTSGARREDGRATCSQCPDHASGLLQKRPASPGSPTVQSFVRDEDTSRNGGNFRHIYNELWTVLCTCVACLWYSGNSRPLYEPLI